MTTTVDVSNVALLEIGQRIRINSLTDPTPAAAACSSFFTPKTQALLRAAHWDFARAQVTLAVYKQALVNGQLSTNPPPQPFLFEYFYPTDCLKVRFLLPTIVTATSPPLTTVPNQYPLVAPAPTGIPFVVGTDRDANGNPIKVILTNLPLAQCVYTRDLSQLPDQWDPLFYSADTAWLGCFLINALARNKAQYDDQVATTKGMIDEARAMNANEGIQSVDRIPDWLRARSTGGGMWWWQRYGIGGGGYGAGAVPWDSVTFPCGLRY